MVSNGLAAAQIFKYLPEGLANAGGFSKDRIKVDWLEPMDTQRDLGYITTIARLHYPETMIAKLQSQMTAPNTPLFIQSSDIVSDLMNNINRDIDIFGGNPSGGSSGSGNSGDGNKDDKNNNTFDSGSGSSSSQQMGTTAGIAVGAIGISVMYGAAMFVLARRYKRKRQANHQRSSSVGSSQASSEMRYTGAGSPALMGGALMSRDMSGYGGVAGGRDSQGSGGNQSARTANISAPMAAENSLGWN